MDVGMVFVRQFVGKVVLAGFAVFSTMALSAEGKG